MSYLKRIVGRPYGGTQNGILGLIAFGWFLTLGTRFLLPAILPQIRGTFEISNTTAGFAITVVWVGYGIMQLPAGVLVDRLGERLLLSLSLALAGVSLGLIGVAPVFGIFLVACGSFGLATGLFGTSRGIALSRFFEPNPGRAFGIALAAGSVGSAALPFVGSALTDIAGWRFVVGLSVPLFVGTAVGTWVTITPRSPQETEDGEFSRGELSESLRRTFTDRAVVAGFLGMVVLLFTFQALTSFLPTYLIEQKTLDQGTANGLFALFFLVGAGFQLLGGSATDRYGTRPVVLLVAAAAALTIGLLPSFGGLLPLTLLIVVTSTQVAGPSVMNPYIIDNLPDEAMGTTWGLLRTVFFVVGATGSTVVGWLSDLGRFDEAFYLLAGLTAVATAIFALLPKR
ncbi:MFS transporter [Natrinema ejinorense]|uniref:MFS transporter n=1 Tax=Natrinema ejinorense TaxID=373386 RepID=UPI001472C549|nr:MFS transporter [Natrinema ejinorense]